MFVFQEPTMTTESETTTVAETTTTESTTTPQEEGTTTPLHPLFSLFNGRLVVIASFIHRYKPAAKTILTKYTKRNLRVALWRSG